jgi:hypothetical protein
MGRRYAAFAALLALLVTGCSDGDGEPATAPTSPPPTSAGASAQTPAPSRAGSSSAQAGPSGGTAGRPAVLRATTALLDWKPVPGAVRDSVTRSGGWTLTVRNGGSYSLDGPHGGSGSQASGTRVGDALMNEDWAVVVLQDKAEQRPSVADVTELASGRTFRLDGGSDVPTTNGGTWALDGDRLLHATIGPGRAYCVATVDLASRESTLGWCAPKRHGFTAAHLTPAGDSLLTFDDSQPSCRTVVALEGTGVTPFEGVPDCKGWDGLVTDDGAVWSVIPRENRIESAHFYARSGDGWFDLGPGNAGSLMWCGGASYFVRDPQRDDAPAALMRWTAADGLSVAYESPAGQAFLSEPRCGGRSLTITALAQAGDEQVTATLP